MNTKSRKMLLFEEKETVKIIEEKQLPPADDQVLIESLVSLVSPGTEIAYFNGSHTQFQKGNRTFPSSPPGYSNVGIVKEIGKDIRNFKPGDRVLAMAGHISCYAVAEKQLVKVPEDLSDEMAVCGILGSISLHGMRDFNLQYGDNILILGMGMIGQMALQLARITPVKNIVAVDLNPMRLEVAKQAGADYCLAADDPGFDKKIIEITNGKGFEAVVEATGNCKVITMALKCAAKRGKVQILGCPHGMAELDLYEHLQRNEVTLIGSYQPNCPEVESIYYPWTQRKNRALILDYLNRGKLDFQPLITHCLPFMEAQKLYDALAHSKNTAIGGIVDWRIKNKRTA